MAFPEEGSSSRQTHLSIFSFLGSDGLQKVTQVLGGHGEQRGACVDNALAALGAPASGLFTDKEPERQDEGGLSSYLPVLGSQGLPTTVAACQDKPFLRKVRGPPPHLTPP